MYGKACICRTLRGEFLAGVLLKIRLSELCNNSVGLDGAPKTLFQPHMWTRCSIRSICSHYCLPEFSEKHPHHKLPSLPTFACMRFVGVISICCLDESTIKPLHIRVKLSQHRSDSSRRVTTKDYALLFLKNLLEISAWNLLFCNLRDSFALVNNPCIESCGFQSSRVFNTNKGSLESRDYFGPANTGGTEVQTML